MCASFNKVMLIGNLTRDPETRSLESGQSVVSFGLAMSRQFMTARGEQVEDVTFVDIEAWGRTGEVVAQYCRKGSPLFVEGRLRYDQWQDRDTGQRRNRLTVRAESIQLLGGPSRGSSYGEEQSGGQRPYQGGSGSEGYGASSPSGGGMPAFQPLSDDTPVSPF